MASCVIEVVCGLKKPGNLCSQTVLSVCNLYHYLSPLLPSCLDLSKTQLNSTRNRFESDKKQAGNGTIVGHKTDE